MKGFLVFVLMCATVGWLVCGARGRRFGADLALDLVRIFLPSASLFVWMWEAAGGGYDWWATHRIDTDVIALAAPAELLEGPQGMLLLITLRNGSAEPTVDRVRLGVRLLDCPKPERSARCDALWQREPAMDARAAPGRESGPAYRRLALPDGFQVRRNLVVEVALPDVRNRK